MQGSKVEPMAKHIPKKVRSTWRIMFSQETKHYTTCTVNTK